MISVERVTVSLNIENVLHPVGELVQQNNKIFFQFYPDFLNTNLEISPIKLKLNKGIHTAETSIFDGLFGVFRDSLPDGWGRLLLDRSLLAKNLSINQITPLDRLCFIGKQGAGALIYEPVKSSSENLTGNFNLDTIFEESSKILKGTSTDLLDELFILGGSSGGARPKVLVGYNPDTNDLIYGVNDLPVGYEHWIIKFPSSFDRPDIAHIEFAYHQLALQAGIQMEKCKLFKSGNGNYFFGTKRFDRIQDNKNSKANQRLHLHSAAGLLHDNFRLSNLDYGHLMDAAFTLERDVRGYEKILRLAAFNVFAHNRDDHSKNFSFLMNAKGEWSFAPAYDLTFSTSSHGFHNTMVAGESQNPSDKHLLKLGNHFGVKHSEQIITEIKETLLSWKDYAKDSGVHSSSLTLIHKTINK